MKRQSFTALDALYIGFISLVTYGTMVYYHPPKLEVVKAKAETHMTPTPTPTPIIPAENWDEFVQTARQIAPMFNFPLKLLLAQASHESGYGTSQYARERNNYFGMCAYDWNPDQACFYENHAQGIIAYIVNIRDTFPEAWENRENPERMLQLLIHNSNGTKYATDPRYIQKIMNTNEWRNN